MAESFYRENISESAMTSGLEWNIKVSQYDSKDILEKIRATFEGYWNNPEFTPFVPQLDAERLRKALKSERRSSQDEVQGLAFNFDIKPYYYQQEILDKLQAEREVHNSFKNLVVAATGTGKTVIAAFDYRDFCRKNPAGTNRLLFVAHRKEILSRWAYGKYNEAEVENLYVFEQQVAKKRAGFIIDAIDRYCTDRKSAAISGRVSCIWRKRIWMCSL